MSRACENKRKNPVSDDRTEPGLETRAAVPGDVAPRPRWRVRAAAFAIVVAAAFALGELASYLGCVVFVKKAAPFLFYEPDETQLIAGLDQYMAQRHPILGWPSPASLGQKDLDETGSRRVPAFPVPGGACVSLYGDSMTWSEEVNDDDAWGNVLARRLRCRVANYGVPGYGLDQAYLRFKLNERDEARISVLTIFPDDVLRDVNQYRAFMTGGTYPYPPFKPRFVLGEDGDLELIPLPAVSKDAFPDFLATPGKYLHHEYFLPETPQGPRSFRFPYTWFLVRAFENELVRGSFRSAHAPPTWAGFFSADHPSGSLPLAAAILEAFDHQARARGSRSLLVILPTPAAIDHHEAAGTWAYQPLIDRLAKSGGPELVNLGPAFLQRLGSRSNCELLSQPKVCRGHYSPEGYALLADIVLGVMRARGLVS